MNNAPTFSDRLITQEFINSLLLDLSLIGEDILESLIPLPNHAKKDLLKTIIEGIFSTVLSG